MLVRDIMTSQVVTVDMDSSVADIKRIFDAAEFHHLIVMEEGRVVGVISDRDELKNISPFVGKLTERAQDAASLKRRVHQIMTRHPKTADPDETAAKAGARMLRDRISCLPVVDASGRLEGIVTLRDMARLAVRLLDPATADALAQGRAA